jgi:hypothetical protein
MPLPTAVCFYPSSADFFEGDQYVGELQTAIEGAHRVARETRKQSQKRMKRDYDVKVRVRELKLGLLTQFLGPLWNLAVMT